MELNPAENPFDWILKGNALRDGKRYDKAISAYEHSLQIDPDYPDAWMGRGEALSALGRGEEAEAARARDCGTTSSFSAQYLKATCCIRLQPRAASALRSSTGRKVSAP
ncbi:MAG: tetratricopeptide repeat protein [Methanothrix sp.]|nr:tetratricopeptide repeat protein [Methanothrix sp.]